MTYINWILTNLYGESHQVRCGILNDKYMNSNSIVENREDSFEIGYTEKGEIEYSILKDMYYPVIRQLIDEKMENKNNDERIKWSLIENIEILDKQHESLMIAKRFLWEEIDRAIYFLDIDCTDEFDEILIDYYENDMFSLPSIYDLEWNFTFIGKLYYYDLKLWKELAHIFIDLKYDLLKYSHYNINAMNENIWRLLSKFRDNRVGHIGTKLWIIFLISIFFEGDKNFRINVNKINIRNNGEFLELVSSYKKKIDDQLIEQQRAIQNDMINLCNFITQVKNPYIFSQKTDDIVKMLNRILDLKKKYINKKETGCFAIMTNGGIKYVAISGLFYEIHFEKFIKDILGSKYELVKCDSSTRYYYNKKKYITYGMYSANKTKCEVIKNIDYVNRMFSCCEKKLLGKLFKKSSKKKYTMYIKMKPCDMCVRALKAYDEVSLEKSYIFYPKRVKKSRLGHLIREYDKVAKEIYEIQNKDTL